jgi:hypothetical protein
LFQDPDRSRSSAFLVPFDAWLRCALDALLQPGRQSPRCAPRRTLAPPIRRSPHSETCPLLSCRSPKTRESECESRTSLKPSASFVTRNLRPQSGHVIVMGRRFFSLTHSRNIQKKAPSQKRVTVNRVQSFPRGKGTGAMTDGVADPPERQTLCGVISGLPPPTIEGTTVAQRSLLDSIGARMPGRGDVGRQGPSRVVISVTCRAPRPSRRYGHRALSKCSCSGTGAPPSLVPRAARVCSAQA